jgi:hypothetical protein
MGLVVENEQPHITAPSSSVVAFPGASPAELRLRLRAAGYAPLPLAGKRPVIEKWPKRTDASTGDIDIWSKLYPWATNTGVLTRLTPAIDIDILEPDAAKAVEQLARERFEERGYFLVRIGRAPKRAILLRTNEPFIKITAPLIAANGDTKQKIEILGDGEQLVVAGIHPDTRRPYTWFGGEPGNIPAEELPYVTEAEMRAFVDDAVRLVVSDYGYQEARKRPKAEASNGHAAPGDNSADWSVLLANIHQGLELHDTICALAAKLVISGMSEGAAVNFIRGALDCSATPRDERFAARLADVKRAVDTAAEKFQQRPEPPAAPLVVPPPWWRDAADIPPRRFLFGKHYIRGTIGATVAAGGRGKTTLGIIEAVSMAVGRDLMTGKHLPAGPLRCWLLNAEEDQDELDRRTAAVCQRYKISRDDLGGRLFVQSVRNQPTRIATLVKNVPTINATLIAGMTDFIKANAINVFMVDPFVSFHGVVESDNMQMDCVIKQGLGAIADATGSAGEIFHHPGKPKPGQAETTVDDARGASAVIWAVRSARVLNFMTTDEAAKLGVPEDERRRHIRIANGKANMGPVGEATWMRIEVENLVNGDQIACASAWSPPNPFKNMTTADMVLARSLAQTGAYRVSTRSPQWLGYALATHLKLDVTHAGTGPIGDPRDIARVKEVLRVWLKNKVLAIKPRKDGERKTRDFYVPGPFRPEPEPTTCPDDEEEE